MSVLNISELKSRFATGSFPASKDYIDLIDTLVAGGVASGSTPSGAAGGSLAGTYPSPTLAANSVGATQVAATSITAAKMNAGAAAVGSIPVQTVDGVAWQAPAGLVTSTNVFSVTGAVNTYTNESSPQALAGTDENIIISLPAGFALPQHVQVYLRFKADYASAGYVTGDVVPADMFAIKNTPQQPAFQVAVYTESGISKVHVRVAVGALNTAGFAVYHKTTPSNPTPTAALVMFADGATITAKLELIIKATRFEAGTGFGSITAYSPSEVSIPVAGEAIVPMAHGFGDLPAIGPLVYLKCTSTDVNFAAGDISPISQFFEVATADQQNPAFVVSAGATYINIRRKPATISTLDKTSGAVVSIDPTKWVIKVLAYKTVSIPTSVFPATSWLLGNPSGAISYKNLLWAFNQSRYAPNSLMTLNLLNLANNTISAMRGGFNGFGFEMGPALSLFKMHNGTSEADYIVWLDSTGLLRLPANSADGLPTQIAGSLTAARKRVVFMDAGVGGTTFAHPTYIYVNDEDGSTGGATFAAVTGTRCVYANGSYTASVIGWPISFLNSGIVNYAAAVNFVPDGTANLQYFGYNPVKKRLYVLPTSSSTLLIYELSTGTLDTWWTAVSPAYAQLSFVKAIAIGGAP